MTPERWAQIEELFHRAADCQPAQRTSLLEEACRTDPDLRREVDALLSSDRSTRDHVQSAVSDGLNAFAYSLAGGVVSHYRILDGLGGGGMGLVYRAEDIRLGRLVALKFLPEESANNPVALARFEREARAVSALSHPNICPIYEFDEYKGQPFLVMELLHGKTLREHLADGAFRLTDPAGLDIAVQVARGLEAAHEQGIIHRDIKPDNIFVTERNIAKILDFGVAKVLEAGEPQELAVAVSREELSSNPVAAHLTHTGLKLGTAAYMSPEQIRGERLDARTDLFSFGLVLYEMTTGQRAFNGETESILHDAILTREPTPVRELAPDISPRLESIICRCLEKEREKRYQSASEVCADLEAAKQSLETAPDSEPALEVLSPVASANPLPSDSGRHEAARLRSFVVTAGVAILAIAGVVYWYVNRPPKLTEKDTILVADFDNKTGDAVFDETLKTALTVALNQSPFLNVLADDRVAATLKLMTRPSGTKLTPDVARELCLRAGSKVYIGGSIANLGNEYVLGLKTVNCQSGEMLAQEQVTASGKEKLLNALGDAAAKLRTRLGEAHSTVQRFDTPLEQASTPSLEALQAYSLGNKSRSDVDDRAAVPFFQRAIQLDPNFAMAYAQLASVYFNRGEHGLSMENIKKGYELRDRVSERERLYIESRYYDLFTGDLEKARQVCELWAQMYPEDPIPRANLAWVFRVLGQYDKAFPEFREAFRLNPDAFNYAGLVYSYVFTNRLEELEEVSAMIREAQAKQLDSPFLHLFSYDLAFLNNDAEGMAKQVAWAAGKPGIEDWMLAYEADTNAFFGRLKTSRDFTRRAVESAERSDQKEVAAGYEANQALWEAMFGNAREARQRAEFALGLSTGRDVQYPAALALASAGDTTRAKTLGDDLDKRFPEDTLVQFNYLPSINAKLALSRKEAAKAVEILWHAASYELGYIGPSRSFYPIYVRGEAYLAAHKGGQAATEFQEILDHRQILRNSPLSALTRLQLARAYVMQGDSDKAKAAYQDFLTLWKEADPDIPIYKQARAEYAKLQ